MWKSGLVPKRMALLGLIGGPMIFASSTAVLFGAYDQTSEAAFLVSLPEIAWEASLGIYLIARGFKTPPGTVDESRHTRGTESLLMPAAAAP